MIAEFLLQSLIILWLFVRQKARVAASKTCQVLCRASVLAANVNNVQSVLIG
jgi:hypothetical protein